MTLLAVLLTEQLLHFFSWISCTLFVLVVFVASLSFLLAHSLIWLWWLLAFLKFLGIFCIVTWWVCSLELALLAYSSILILLSLVLCCSPHWTYHASTVWWLVRFKISTSHKYLAGYYLIYRLVSLYCFAIIGCWSCDTARVVSIQLVSVLFILQYRLVYKSWVFLYSKKVGDWRE